MLNANEVLHPATPSAAWVRAFVALLLVGGCKSSTAVPTQPASTLLLSGIPSAIPAGDAVAFTVTAKDVSGATVTNYAGTVHFTSSDPSVLLPADYSFTSAVAGSAHFNVRLPTMGTQTVTVTEVSGGSLTSSQSVTVSAASKALYVGNMLGHSLTVYPPTASGNVSPTRTIEGSNTALYFPSSAALDAAGGRLFIVNGQDASIRVFPAGATGNVRPIATIKGINTGLAPEGIAFDATAAMLYVTNNYDGVTVYPASATGDVTPAATIVGENTGLHVPVGVAVDPIADRVYVSNSNRRITIYPRSANGDVVPAAVIEGNNTGLSFPQGLAIDAAGQLYVANHDNNSITIFSAGATGDVAPAAIIAGSNTQLDGPAGVAVDETGRVYVTNNGAGGSSGPGSVTIYASGASGNIAPVATIAGNQTGLLGVALIAY